MVPTMATRQRHRQGQAPHDENGSTTATARCGFSWHVAAIFGLVATVYVASFPTQREAPDDETRRHLPAISTVLVMGSTVTVALFLAIPMIYFLLNTTRVVS